MVQWGSRKSEVEYDSRNIKGVSLYNCLLIAAVIVIILVLLYGMAVSTGAAGDHGFFDWLQQIFNNTYA